MFKVNHMIEEPQGKSYFRIDGFEGENQLAGPGHADEPGQGECAAVTGDQPHI